MIKFQVRNRGIALLSALALTVILLMMVGVVVKRGESGLYRTARYRDGLQAAQAARGGANHLLALLNENASYASDQSLSLGSSTYDFTFDTTQEYFCVNNLNGGSASPQLSYLGRTVPPYTADLFITGRCGTREKIVHVVLQRGLSTAGSVSAVGKVTLGGDVEIDGIKTLVPPPGQTDPEPAPGGIISKFRSPSSAEPSIDWDGSGTFSLSSLSRLEAAPVHPGGVPVSSNVAALYPDSVIRSAAADTLPEMDIPALVASGMGSPPLPGIGSTRTGYVYVSSDHSQSGDLTINGNLELVSGSALFVDGDLTVNGSVRGIGSVYVSGDVTVQGGDAVVSTSEPQGAAILSGGKVTLQGLDAGGYLDTLGTSYGFSPDVDRLKVLLQNYQDTSGAPQFWSLSVQIGKHDGTSSGQNAYISPIPGPDGTHNQGFANGAAAKVALDIKSLHPGYSADPRAHKVVRALEQIQYHFRHNLHTVAHNGTHYTDQSASNVFTLGDDYQLYSVSGGPVSASAFDLPPNAMLGMSWDDATYPLSLKSHDSLTWSGNAAYHAARRDAFFNENNPLDTNWLGESSFQGLLYAQGDIEVGTKFKIVGAVVSLGNVNFSNGSTLIFNEDYKDLVGLRAPIGIHFYEEY